jgi:NAD(P)H-flavin reductase
MVPTMHRVVERTEELADTVTLVLEAVDDGLPPPAPGQFNMLWAFGIGESAISVARFDDGTLSHTIRRVGTVTSALCEMKPDDLVGVRGPFGAGWDLDGATGGDVLIVAGGLGIAPVRPLVDAVIAERAAYGAVTLLFGARSPDLLLYAGEIASWRSRFDLEVEVTVDAADPSWRGDVGVVTKLIDRVRSDPATTTAFVCGPEVMMRFVAEALVDSGVPPDRLRLSLERNMHCAIGHCGHCQLGPLFVCKDGPVVPWTRVRPLLAVRDR